MMIISFFTSSQNEMHHSVNLNSSEAVDHRFGFTNGDNNGASCPHCSNHPQYGMCYKDFTNIYNQTHTSCCDDLYNTDNSSNFYGQLYMTRKRDMNRYIEILKIEFLEGSVQNKSIGMCYYDIARRPGVKTICEIGFNYGMSTLGWLVSNPQAKVYSWDLNVHSYTKVMVRYLNFYFPNRITMFYGNSMKTVPKVANMYKGTLKCDIISVDGGHKYEVTKADILNMNVFSHKDSILIVDDVFMGYQKYGQEVTRAWNEAVKAHLVIQNFHCRYKDKNRGGFVIGKYVH